jgi:hypothetical protein
MQSLSRSDIACVLCSALAAVQAFGVLGGSPSGPLEVEGEPGISLTLAELPGVELSLMHTLRSTIPSEGEAAANQQ